MIVNGKADSLDGDADAEVMRLFGKVFTPEKVEERKARAIVEAHERQKKAVAELRSNWNAPKIHAMRNADHSGPFGKTEGLIASKLGSGMLIALVGRSYVGKTQLAVEVMRVATGRLMSARYASSWEFFRLIDRDRRSSFRDDLTDAVDMHLEPQLLVIDEFDRRSDSQWHRDQLFGLINSRYQSLKDTILISNLSVADFEASIDPALASRMNSSGALIECNWPPFKPVPLDTTRTNCAQA